MQLADQVLAEACLNCTAILRFDEDPVKKPGSGADLKSALCLKRIFFI